MKRPTGRAPAPPTLQRLPPRPGAPDWLRAWEDRKERHEDVLAVNYVELEARARAMMPLPKCSTCGTPFAPDGDGALADSFHQACACPPGDPVTNDQLRDLFVAYFATGAEAPLLAAMDARIAEDPVVDRETDLIEAGQNTACCCASPDYRIVWCAFTFPEIR